MVFNFVDLRYCLLFGLLKVSIGLTIGQGTGSDVSFAIDFQRYPTSCKEVEIYFSGLGRKPNWSRKIMLFFDNADKCLSVVSKEYTQRIFNAEINFPISVTFIILNVSSQDTGKYYATAERNILGERILFVTDTDLRACTGKQEEINFVLPLSPFKEAIDVMFYSSMMQPLAVVHVADPISGVCTAYVKYLQCRIKECSLSITIKSVHFIDQGIYAFIGHGSGVVHESAILYVTDQSFMIQKEYFFAGGAVAGIVLVTLTCLFICKRCRLRTGKVASDGAYANIDVHHNSILRNQDQLVSDNVDSARSFPESQRCRAVTIETNVYDEIRFGIATDVSSEANNQSEIYYITPY